MKIEFSKEDIEQIRRIARQEISRVLNKACIELNKEREEEYRTKISQHD